MKVKLSDRKRGGFTLVEMLVVITIISILASLVLVGASAAMRAARRASIKTEIDQLDASLQEYKQQFGSFPPNALVTTADIAGLNTNQRQMQVLNDLKRHFQQAFGKHEEPEVLFRALAGIPGSNYKHLDGGMRADEAIFFWLGGFSDDKRYPVSGKGGPAFDPSGLEDLEGRDSIYTFDVGRLGPRNASNAFDEQAGRFITYEVTPGGPKRRINFWTYAPSGYEAQLQYFDTSRYKPAEYDPVSSGQLVALKTQPSSGIPSGANAAQIAQLVQFANPQSFQILHAGIDDEWGDAELWALLTVQQIASGNGRLYPTGPFTDELADTQVNFSTQTLEDSQP